MGAKDCQPRGPSYGLGWDPAAAASKAQVSLPPCLKVSLPASCPTDASQGRIQEGILGLSSSILSMTGLTTTQMGMNLGRKGQSRPGIRDKVPAMSPEPLGLMGNQRCACKTRSFEDFF